MQSLLKNILLACAVSAVFAASAFANAADDYNVNLAAHKDGDAVVVEITNNNDFVINDLTLTVGDEVTQIGSIAGGATWTTGDEAGADYSDFVPAGYYNGALNTDPGYDGHCAVVEDEPEDWTKVLTADADGTAVTLEFQTLGARILFVGNSQTYFFSSAPYFFRELSQMGGYNAQVAYSLYGGSTLPMIAGMTTMAGRDSQPVDTFQQAKNANDYYDVISYHALTDEPIRKDAEGNLTMFDDFMKATQILDLQTKARGAKMVFMSTWGYRYGYIMDSINLPLTDDPVGTMYEFDTDSDGTMDLELPKTLTRTEMELALRENYQKAADSVGAGIIPVGQASEYVSANFPELKMYYKDCKHPTNLHDYLTACVYYAAIYHDSPVGLGIPPVFDETNEDAGIITEEDAAIIQKVASMVVLGTEAP